MKLAEQRCKPCEGGVEPLTREEAEKLLGEIPYWELADDAKSVRRAFKFRDWLEAVAFTNKISDLAEEEGHHPDIELRWGSVGIALSTHAIGGLSVNDFILAAKIDGL